MAITGFGTKLEYLTPPSTYTALAGVLDVDGPAVEVGEHEVSSNDSVGRFAEFLPGLCNAGEISCDLWFAKAQTTTIYPFVGVVKGYRITFSDGSTFVFSGFIKHLGHSAPMAGGVKQSCKIKVTGQPVYTAGT